MKIKDGYILKKVANSHIVVPVGELDFDGVITLNETAVFIWELLQKEKSEEEIVSEMKKEYDAPEELIKKDVSAFIQKLRENGILDE